MLVSGASLVRSSGQQAERAERLKIVAPVQTVESPAPSQSPLDGGTHDALERFARFINREKRERKATSQSAKKKGLPEAYRSQIEIHTRRQDQGTMLDITV